MWMLALSHLQISVAYPVAVGLNFVVVVLIALVVLGERVSFLKVAGIVLIFISIYLITRDGR